MNNLEQKSILPARSIYRIVLIIAILLGPSVCFLVGSSHREIGVMESQDLDIAVNLFKSGHLNLPIDQSPAYYLFLHFWSAIGPSSWTFLRIPSALFIGIAAVFLFFLMEAEVSLLGGLLAALFFALNPFIFAQACTARMYALVIMLASGCIYFAHRYLAGERKIRHLAGFLVMAVLGIYTHLFMLLFVGSLGLLFIAAEIPHARNWKSHVIILSAGAIGLVAIAPQLEKIFRVMRHTAWRATIYGGIAHKPIPFLKTLGKDFFIGAGRSFPHSSWLFIALVVLAVAGMIALRKRGIIAGTAIFAPSLAAMWRLSESNPVGSRYIVYLLPVIFCFIAALIAKMRSTPYLRYVWTPLAAAIVFQGAWLIRAETARSSDWNVVLDYIKKYRTEADEVAVFPEYWRPTFARLYKGSFTPVNGVASLLHVMASSRRVFVLRSPGRYSDNIELHAKTLGVLRAEVHNRVGGLLRVLVIDPKPREKILPEPTDDPAILLTGSIGSGGYPWQAEDGGGNPFEAWRPYFRSSDLVMIGYEPYAKPAYNWKQKLFGHARPDFREPNEKVAGYLAEAGANAAAILEMTGGNTPKLLRNAGIKPIELERKWDGSKPAIVDVKGVKTAFLNVRQNVFTDRPSFKKKGDAVTADWEKAVASAKQKVGPDGRLVVFLPPRFEFDRLPRSEDQLIARRAIDLGADAVVGMGGRVGSRVETYKDGVIAYSLGSLMTPPFIGRDDEASGLMLRLAFPASGPVRFEIFPATSDGRFRSAVNDWDTNADLMPPNASGLREEPLIDKLIHAKASLQSRDNKPISITQWSSRVEEDNSIHEGWTNGGAAAAVCGATVMGDYHRAIILRPRNNKSIRLKFEKVSIGETLRFSYGVADQTIMNTGRKPQTLKVSIGGKKIFTNKINFLSNWKIEEIDTARDAGQEKDIEIVLETSKKQDFSVLVDPVVIRSAVAVAGEEEKPFRFIDHFHEAAVRVESADGAATPCYGPDETYRLLRNEEKGPYAEGVIYKRWVCGDLPWDASALTFQKSGAQLRQAIWLHPLKDAKRYLSFERIKLRKQIEGYYGFTDLSLKKMKAPAEFVVLANEKEVYRQKVEISLGWRSFAFDLPDVLAGSEGTISFLVETTNQSWQHFCFNAWMN